MTGLYNNISDIQNVKSLTFLLRSQRTILEPLNINMISNKYQQIFKIEKKNSDKLAIATKGYAFCYQLLGDILFKKEKTIIDEDILNELDEKLYEYCYEKIYSDLSDIDKLIISTFKEERVYKTNEILSSINMNIKLFSLYRDRLTKRGILISRGYGKIELILPRFNIVTLKYTIVY